MSHPVKFAPGGPVSLATNPDTSNYSHRSNKTGRGEHLEFIVNSFGSGKIVAISLRRGIQCDSVIKIQSTRRTHLRCLMEISVRELRAAVAAPVAASRPALWLFSSPPGMLIERRSRCTRTAAFAGPCCQTNEIGITDHLSNSWNNLPKFY